MRRLFQQCREHDPACPTGNAKSRPTRVRVTWRFVSSWHSWHPLIRVIERVVALVIARVIREKKRPRHQVLVRHHPPSFSAPYWARAKRQNLIRYRTRGILLRMPRHTISTRKPPRRLCERVSHASCRERFTRHVIIPRPAAILPLSRPHCARKGHNAATCFRATHRAVDRYTA